MEFRNVYCTLGGAKAGGHGKKLFALSTKKYFQASLLLLALSLLLAVSFPSYGKFHQFIHSFTKPPQAGFPWIVIQSVLHKGTHLVATAFLSGYCEPGPDEKTVVPATMELTV